MPRTTAFHCVTAWVSAIRFVPGTRYFLLHLSSNGIFRNWHLALFFLAAAQLASPANAEDLAQPTGEILLTVSGNLSHKNHAAGAAFDLQMLESLETTSFVTETPWTKGQTKFTGVTLKHLLEVVGTEPESINLIAEDGYIYELDYSIDDKYPVIVAYKKNDEYMSLRQLGPLWLIFPFDDFPELDTEKNKAASVWQLIRMELK